ncbi:hypothetical protein V1291_004013 [Nitrobacteraceae bacterium AZCC 1564]
MDDFADDTAAEGQHSDDEDRTLNTVTHSQKLAGYCCMTMTTKAPTTGLNTAAAANQSHQNTTHPT